MRKIVWGVLIIVIIIGVFMFRQESDASIKVGVILPLSGDFASFGEAVKRGIEQIQNDDILYVFEDTKCESAETVSAATKLLNIDQVKYIIGPVCGSPQEVIAPLIKDK